MAGQIPLTANSEKSSLRWFAAARSNPSRSATSDHQREWILRRSSSADRVAGHGLQISKRSTTTSRVSTFAARSSCSCLEVIRSRTAAVSLPVGSLELPEGHGALGTLSI
jgi:hypothetical protein